MRVLLLFVLLAGCAAPDTRTINLSEHTTKRFERYSKLPDPYFFAVTMDGRHSDYSYCTEAFNCQRSGARQAALDACKVGSSGKACHVIAYANKITWAGKVNFKR